MKEESTTSKVTELIRRAVLSSLSAQGSNEDGDELYVAISRDTCTEVTSQNHRITESQNVRGWKGPLWVI